MLEPLHADFSRRFADLGRVYVAGGAVRDSLMGKLPKDYDVFVSGQFNQDDASKRCSDLQVVKAMPTHAYEPFLRGTFCYNGAEVQVMSTPHESLAALVDSFDWNVCLFGFDGLTYERRTALEDIAPGKPLVLQRVTYPRSTLRRGFHFSERFKMQFAAADVSRLCSLVTASNFDWKIR